MSFSLRLSSDRAGGRIWLHPKPPRYDFANGRSEIATLPFEA